MDAIKAAFERQFGTEWSAPVAAADENDDDNFAGFDSDEAADQDANAKSDKKASKKAHKNAARGTNAEEYTDRADREPARAADDDDERSRGSEDGPVTIKHDESGAVRQPLMTKAQRRRFMASGAPLDDSIQAPAPDSKDGDDDLQNDIALQRLIEESHILTESKNQFSGADISGAVDPMDHVGKTRLKVMEARLEKAGAKRNAQRMPQAMAVGIRDKRAERTKKVRDESREAGIVIAKDRHTRSKNRIRDKGLKINSVGRASEHGIHISAAEIAKVTGKNKRPMKRRR